MTSRHAPFLSLLIGFIVIPCMAEECKLPRPYKTIHDHQEIVDMPGYYCLKEDVVQSPIFDIHAFSFKSQAGSPLLDIGYDSQRANWDYSLQQWKRNRPLTDDDVFDVDLQGHTLKGKADNLVGISAGGVRNVRVYHGIIDVPGNRSPNVGVNITNKIGQIRVPAEKFGVSIFQRAFEDTSAAETVDGKPPTYTPSNSIVEHLTIKAGWRGVEMGGAHNILRHNTIEVDGHTAVFMAGPGSIIEDNTIIVHGKGDAGPFDAPIKLRDAHGAVVRNNRIIYRGWFFKAPVAINLLDSTHVVIENNAIDGVKSLTRCKGECKFSDTGNSFK